MTRYANLQALQTLPASRASVRAVTTRRAGPDGANLATTVTITNTSRATVAFLLRADVRRGTKAGHELPGDNELQSSLWQDNDVTLFPGESQTLTDAARAVGGRARLDVTLPGERARQVGDLALHAVRERIARADHERTPPAVGAQSEVHLLLDERLVGAGPAVVLVERVGNRKTERVRRGVALPERDPQPERIALGEVLAHPQLRRHVGEQQVRRDDRLAVRLAHRLEQFGLTDGAVVVEVQGVPAGRATLRDVRPACTPPD
jgi:Exo-beta-D-glucosaminidase Ig-fold domain